MPPTLPPSCAIATRGLSKRFGRQWVIRDFTEDFAGEEVVGIRGRNGSGKSTLLRMLTGQLTPSRGEITWTIGGHAVATNDIHRYLSWTGPYMEIVEELTITEFLTFHFGLKPLADDLSVGEVIHRIELETARQRTIQDCSSGMRQRVLLATALYARTPLLILDEPTVTLDAAACAWFQRELRAVRPGRLVLIASNAADDLQQCNRLLDLD